MVSIAVVGGATRIEIAGLGVTVAEQATLSNGVMIVPGTPELDLQEAADHSEDFNDYAAVFRGRNLASFTLVVEHPDGGQSLLGKSWNALWQFHLLSLAAGTPCCSLYSVCRGDTIGVGAANRNIMFPPFPAYKELTPGGLAWMQNHQESFGALISNNVFNSAMRCYCNSHYLFDHDMRIMLLWSGIEGLLSVDAELTRRIALYSALMLLGTKEEKVAHFDRVKKAYNIRSKAVHGGGATQAQLELGYVEACDILVILLRRCVELGRVPSAKELDALASSATLE